MTRSSKQSGYVLLPVIVVITLVAAIALLMNTESALESNVASSELDKRRVQYIAEASLNHGLWKVRQQGCGPYGDLLDEPLGNDKYTTTLTTDLGSTTAFTINVDQDSWILSDLPTENKAADLNLHTRNEALGTERSLVRYDLSPITANAPILSATAWFYITNAHAAGPIDIHLTSADWTENDATWDSMNANRDSAVLATIPGQPVNNTWIQVNLTSQVQAWVNGQSNFGITLNSTVDGVHGQYNSRESVNPPYLDVIVGTPPTSPATLKGAGTLANGVTRDITRSNAVLYQHPPGMLHLQPDAVDGEDAEIWAQGQNNNYGSAAETWVSSRTNDTTRSLLRFNIGAIPVGARILGASLSLELQSGEAANDLVSAHRILNPWSEATVTWNRRETGINWDTAGSDFDNVAVATTPVGPANQRYAWNITPLVQGWVEGSYPNNGVVLVAAIPGMKGERFYTSDHADQSRWPSLSITYACTCGTVCVTPQGSGKIIMIGNWPVLSPDLLDLEKEAIIESWGYEVDQADDNFIWAINFSNYDLVYISETVSSAAVTGQISWRSIGIVNEQSNLNPDFGFATGNGTSVGDSVDITDNSHYISAPFALGSLPIYSAQMEIVSTSGTLAGGGRTLAEAGGAESLMLLDTGASSVNGPAAGRRVALPLGRNGSFSWDHLNANGRLLVQRALTWGAGLEATTPSMKVLFVVRDTAALGPQDTVKKTLMESWNFSVTLIAATDSQAGFDAASTSVDVAYVSEEITSGDLNTKLRNASIGVVIEETALTDEFGVSSSHTGYSGTDIEVVDSTHYITLLFPLGPLAITTSATGLDRLGGTPAPALETLAQSGGNPELITIETGGQLYDTGTAAGRRVKMPWGTDAFDINLLTADGEILMRRAIEWAGGAGVSGATGPIAHWKLDETSGLNAEDFAAANDGTLTGVPVWIPGLIDGGLDFDGSDDYVDAGTFDVAGSGITMMGWFNAEAIGTDDGRFISKASGSAEADAWWQLSTTDVGADRYLRMRIKAGGTTSTFADSSINLVTDRWYFAVGTYDSASGDMKLYLDGVEVASGSHALGGALDTDPSVPVAIGANGTVERFFDGILDDVRVYDRALSSAEIAELAKLPGPIAHWKLDETSGTTAVDSVGGNDASFSGNPTWTGGVVDGALEFDGSGDFVTTDADFTPPPAGTVSFWMKVPGSPASHGRILGLDDTWEIRHVTTGTPDGIAYGLVFDLGVSGVNTEFITTVTVDTPDQWYFVVATYDTNTDAYAVYLDGVLHKSGTYPTSLALPADKPLSIGARTGSTNYFDGTLDDVRIYDRGLDDTEIADLFAAAGGGGGPTIFEVRVATGSDDAEERVSGGNANNNSSDLELLTDGSKNQLVGMRFTSVTIPNGTAISSAYIQFQVDENNSGVTSVNIQGQDIDDAPTFTTGNSNISSRSRTLATVPWAPVPWTTVGEAGADQQTPNIAAVIQEIVNRGGWVSGNDLVIIMTGSGERTAESYNGDSSGAALLHIQY